MRPGLRMLAILAGLALLGPIAIAQNQKQGDGPQQLKQIKLTEPKVKSFITAQKQLAPLASKLENTGDTVDPALQKEVEKIATGNGFSNLQEFDDVAANISVVLAGLDPQTGQFTEPPEQIKKDMEEIKQDGQMAQKDKDEALAQMQAALKVAAPLQFKENVAVVKKYQKELDEALQSGQPQQQTPEKQEKAPKK